MMNDSKLALVISMEIRITLLGIVLTIILKVHSIAEVANRIGIEDGHKVARKIMQGKSLGILKLYQSSLAGSNVNPKQQGRH